MYSFKSPSSITPCTAFSYLEQFVKVMPHPSTIAEPCNTAPTPQPFLQVFENGASYVVVSFDTDAAVEEGDVTEYMNELARLNSVPGSWQLCKSAPHWGLVQVLPPIIAMHAPQWTHRSFIHSFHFIHSFIHFIHLRHVCIPCAPCVAICASSPQVGQKQVPFDSDMSSHSSKLDQLAFDVLLNPDCCVRLQMSTHTPFIPRSQLVHEQCCICM